MVYTILQQQDVGATHFVGLIGAEAPFDLEGYANFRAFPAFRPGPRINYLALNKGAAPPGNVIVELLHVNALDTGQWSVSTGNVIYTNTISATGFTVTAFAAGLAAAPPGADAFVAVDLPSVFACRIRRESGSSGNLGASLIGA